MLNRVVRYPTHIPAIEPRIHAGKASIRQEKRAETVERGSRLQQPDSCE